MNESSSRPWFEAGVRELDDALDNRYLLILFSLLTLIVVIWQLC